jgi:aldehyde dehydrogenase (NAD+)
MQTYRNLIGGRWVDASDGATFELRNPARPGERLGTFPAATPQDARAAVAAASEAFAAWASTPPPARGEILYRAAQLIADRLEELAAALTQEEGKTLAESRVEVARSRDILRYYGGEGWRAGGHVLPPIAHDEMIYTRREPLGVVAAITPWNFPMAIPTWKVAPALAYGNTVVLKPASLAPRSALLLVEILHEAGLPPGVINLLTGSGAVVGDELVSHPDVAAVSFTGSYAVGRDLYGRAIGHMARVQLEMGGKNPLVVLSDADLDLAVNLAVKGGYGLTGQSCTATSRVIVEESIASRFATALARATDALVVGDGLEPRTQMGPAVSRGQMEQDLEYVRVGLDEGAELLAGHAATDGETQAGPGGHFVRPVLFDRVEPGMRIAQEEIFGPVVGILRARNLDDAVATANASGYGLAAGIVTNDLHRALAFAEAVDAGVVKVNQPTTGVALHAPFGGFGHSSANTFKEQGQAAVEFYTRTKTVYVSHGG